MNQDTRQRILEKNFVVMHKHGFQGTRADKVVKELGITKGAFYHYFENKLTLGYAIVEEIIGPMYQQLWQAVAQESGDPLLALERLLRSIMAQQPMEKVSLGCPLNNLIQEMSPLDEGFRLRLQRILEDMKHSAQRGLERGIREGYVREEVQAEQVAVFLVASTEGAFGMAKVLKSPVFLEQAMEELIGYVRGLGTGKGN
jgi:AcrR family transcriptional regulator